MKRCLIQLKNTDGSQLGSVLDIPLDTNVEKLHLLCNALRKQQQAKSSNDNDSDDVPFLFYVGSVHVADTLENALKEQLGIGDDEQGAAKRQRTDGASDADTTEKPSLGERVVEIVCRPQALVRVLPATRCTATCEGHSEAVVSVQFSPDGARVASGAGDATVRIWDASSTQSCEAELRRHANWVLAVAWSPLGDLLASADRNGVICVWQSTEHSEVASTSEKAGESGSLYTLKSELRGHRKWITSISWRPLHVTGGNAAAGSTNEAHETEASRYLVSASKDCTAIVWDVVLRRALRTLSGHTACVTSVRWGADNLIYTASEDCSIRVWRPTDGVLCRVLETHAHWVNQLATHVDFVLRTGVFDLERAFREHKTQRAEVENSQRNGSSCVDRAATRFRESEAHRLFETDRLASASDDFTVCLWQPGSAAKPLARLAGHKQPVNQVAFAPDGRVLASASFDRSVKLWDAAARSAKAIATLHGHVSRVYQVAFAADSRSLVSAGSDSTVKVWDVRAAKYRMNVQLSGHADEVYAVDWSPDGAAIASGSKDRTLKLWRP